VLSATYQNDNPDYYFEPATILLSDPPGRTSCQNQALEKFYAKTGDQSSWGTNLAEAEQAVSTVEHRCLQLAHFANALRKGNFSEAAKVIGAVKPKNLKAGAKSFANNFLEWHFGWEPALADIHDACSTMTKADFGYKRISGQHSLGNRAFKIVDEGGGGHFTQTDSYSHCCKIWADIRVGNDDSYLANQLGLVNPLSVAWDLVPYSFVVDWFTNVGSVLNSITGLIGLQVRTGSSGHTSSLQALSDQLFIGGPADPGHVTAMTHAVFRTFTVERIPGIPPVTLELKTFKGFSPMRGLTALSLLLQKL